MSIVIGNQDRVAPTAGQVAPYNVSVNDVGEKGLNWIFGDEGADLQERFIPTRGVLEGGDQGASKKVGQKEGTRGSLQEELTTRRPATADLEGKISYKEGIIATGKFEVGGKSHIRLSYGIVHYYRRGEKDRKGSSYLQEKLSCPANQK